MESENLKAFGIGLLTGAIIGGAIALLYAPKTGKETRQLIKDKVTEVVDTVKEKTSGAVHALKS
jgi:gas vesicle protein